jgi:3-hydroxyacyl-[acyl-carrier-protein] dehydratase
MNTSNTTLDRVLHLNDERAEAIRNVPSTLEVFDTHFPRFPVLPGVMILDTVAELAAALLEHRTGAKWILAGVDRARYRHFVRPGDQLSAAVVVTELCGSEAALRASASVDGVPVATMRTVRMVRESGRTVRT